MYLIYLCLSLIKQVFGTDVMVTVAKSFDGPIKCEFCRNNFL